MVIASLKRLMAVRQRCWKRKRIALISVPAWPMPIHQTKLVMSKAQPTGMLFQAPILHQGDGDRQGQRAAPGHGDGEREQPALSGAPRRAPGGCW
jgi:hypothetical protein